MLVHEMTAHRQNADSTVLSVMIIITLYSPAPAWRQDDNLPSYQPHNRITTKLSIDKYITKNLQTPVRSTS